MGYSGSYSEKYIVWTQNKAIYVANFSPSSSLLFLKEDSR